MEEAQVAEQHDDGERLRDQVVNGELTLTEAYEIASNLKGTCPCPCGLPLRSWAVASLPGPGRIIMGAPLASRDTVTKK